MENNFDLGKIAIEQTNGKGETVKVVPAGNRTAWFRYVYPQGKISKRIAAMGNDANGNPTITVECRVYCSYNDPDENFLANAFATRSYLPNDPIGQHYQQCAETAAKVRALVDAGFTLVNESFADFDDSGVGSMNIALATVVFVGGGSLRLRPYITEAIKARGGAGAVKWIPELKANAIGYYALTAAMEKRRK